MKIKQVKEASTMSDILWDISDQKSVIGAIENNTAEFLLAMGKAGGGEAKRNEEITWTIGGSPIDYHNAVVYANLSSVNVDNAVHEVIERLTVHQVPGSWHLSPSMQPDDLGKRLESYGFRSAGNEPGMAAYLPTLNERWAWPDGFMVDRVRDIQTLETWRKTLAVGFGEGAHVANWAAAIYRKIGLGDDVPWRHYIGWLDGEPVATTSMYLAGGVAGIYFVFTVPQARRRGIGGAITLTALHDAISMGYRVGVLGSSGLGFPVYERLGFQQYCSFVLYEWHHDANSA